MLAIAAAAEISPGRRRDKLDLFAGKTKKDSRQRV